MMRLNNLKPNPGAKHRKRRVGSGESSGLGKTCGKGHKGQKSRSGGGAPPGFEGGQMPLYRRIPRRGFNNARFRDKIVIVNVGSLEDRFDAGSAVNEASLRAANLVKGSFDGIKLLGEGDLTKALNVQGVRVSASAREKVEKAGGSISESAPTGNDAPAPEPEPAPVAEEPPVEAAVEPEESQEAADSESDAADAESQGAE